MLLTELEKAIYNEHLAASRIAKKKPYRVKKDFTSIDDKIYCAVKKLGLFFKQNKNINMRDFFIAPYLYYNSDQYFDITYFNTFKAIKCYTLFIKNREVEDPDSEYIINTSKECCKFVYHFCRENNLNLKEYVGYINGTTPVILQHLRDHKINFYTLHSLEAGKTIRSVDTELLDFFIQDFESILVKTRINFQKSIKLKIALRKCLYIIECELLKNKTNSL